MNLGQVAAYLGFSREQAKTAIRQGVMPPGAAAPVVLHATPRGSDFEIDDKDLNAFIAAFEKAQPGRNPPVEVRRTLLIEARERCAICGEAGPFEFHHLLDWAKLKHHDPQHMMLLCRNCHGKCTSGVIDHPRQAWYKKNPYWKHGLFAAPDTDQDALASPLVTWEDLRTVVTTLHAELKAKGAADPRYDFEYADIDRKNELNRLSKDYANTLLRQYEPKLLNIKRFLGDDRNADMQDLYYEVVGDLRLEIAAIQGREPNVSMDDVLRRVFERAFVAFGSGPKVNREALRAVIAFMYFECDIGRK